MEYFGPSEALEQLKGATVVLPAVAFANVGELAVDVLVASLRPMAHVGQLHSASVLPCVGNDAFGGDEGSETGQGQLCTALELYRWDRDSDPAGQPSSSGAARPVFIIQQRAPAAKGRQAAFAAELTDWLRQHGVGRVVVLSGLDGQLRRDRQIDGPPTRFLANPPLSELSAASSGTISHDLWVELEPDIMQEEQKLHGLLQPWPLLSELSRGGVPHVLVATFASEGDNGPDGLHLAAQALPLLLLGATDAVQLRPPRSWVAMYGRTFAQELY